MIIALTGTPGTGKTSVASLLEKKGYKIIELNALAKEKGFIAGYDKKRKCSIIDVKRLENYLMAEVFEQHENTVLDGLLSHLLKGVDTVIILRCHPRELEKRLKNKGWDERKIRENVEAEALDVILCEAAELHKSSNLYEINTTDKSPEKVAEIVDGIIHGRFNKGEYDIGKIDWSEEIV